MILFSVSSGLVVLGGGTREVMVRIESESKSDDRRSQDVHNLDSTSISNHKYRHIIPDMLHEQRTYNSFDHATATHSKISVA